MFSMDSSKDPVSQSKSLKENDVNQSINQSEKTMPDLYCLQHLCPTTEKYPNLFNLTRFVILWIYKTSHPHHHYFLWNSFLSNSGFILNSIIPFCLSISTMLSWILNAVPWKVFKRQKQSVESIPRIEYEASKWKVFKRQSKLWKVFWEVQRTRLHTNFVNIRIYTDVSTASKGQLFGHIPFILSYFSAYLWTSLCWQFQK